jgi:hypothetical protein
MDRSHIRPDGPPSQRIVFVALNLAGVLCGLGFVAWLVGLIEVAKLLAGSGSGVAAVMLIAALFVERRERHDEG